MRKFCFLAKYVNPYSNHKVKERLSSVYLLENPYNRSFKKILAEKDSVLTLRLFFLQY